MNRITDTVKHLLIINGIAFLATSLYGSQLYNLLALHYYKNPLFQIWQPLTHMFLHGNFSHILFNMIGLWMFGSPLEQLWGRNKFIFFYLSSGLGAAALQILYSSYDFNSIFEILVNNGFNSEEIINTIETSRYNLNWLSYISEQQLSNLNESYNLSMVGASGALYGILVAFAFLFPNVSLFNFYTDSNKGKVFCTYFNCRRPFFWCFKFFFNRPYCTFCSRWRCFNRFSYDDLLEKKSI